MRLHLLRSRSTEERDSPLHVHIHGFLELALVDLPRIDVVLVPVIETSLLDWGGAAAAVRPHHFAASSVAVVGIGFEFAAHARCDANAVGSEPFPARATYVAFVVSAAESAVVADYIAADVAVVAVVAVVAERAHALPPKPAAAAAIAAFATVVAAMNVAAVAAVTWPSHVSKIAAAQQDPRGTLSLLEQHPASQLCHRLDLDYHLLADLQ